MSTHNQSVRAAESRVKKYLDSFATPDHTTRGQSFNRAVCCKTSQSLYCKECCRLLVPEDALPLPINLRRKYTCNGETAKNSKPRIRSTERKSRLWGHGEKLSCDILDERPLRLPFDLHLILDDRRGSSTGLHAVALLDISRDKTSLGKDGTIGTQYKNCQHSCGDFGAVTLTDVEKLDVLEQSEVLNHAMNFYVESNSGERGASTFFLFPCPGESVPLESVSNQVKTLVVLDCKWTKSGVWRRSEKLRQLPKVHLSHPPTQSHFWRWHNAGPGMMSTIEAVYYASLEIYQSRHKQLTASSAPQSCIDECLADENNLLHLLWLFGHQRQSTMEKARNAGKVAPCVEDGKELQRALRRRKK